MSSDTIFWCIGNHYTAYMDYVDLAVRERLLNLITHSLTHNAV